MVKLCNLPEAGKSRLHEDLLARPERVKQSRKQKRVTLNTDFLTPDEVEEIKLKEEIKLEAETE